MSEKKEFHYFDRPTASGKVWIMLCLTCALTILPDFLIHRHPHFAFDHVPGFYAGLGFLSCAALIFFSKLAGVFLKKREGYYDN